MSDVTDHVEAVTVEHLKPCRDCGAECRIETFGPSELIEGKVSIWVCSQHRFFGGKCPSTTAYLNVAAWNTRPADDVVREGLADIVKLLRATDQLKANGFASDAADIALGLLHDTLPKQTDAEPMCVLLPPASVDGKYLEGWCEGQAYLIENYGKEGEGDKAIALTTEYLDATKQTDAVEAVFETPDGFVMGQTAAKVKRIERQDDGTLTVVIDHWPDAVEAERERIADWFEGKGGVIPGAAAFAPLVSGNNQPCMSGDPRDRLRPHQRERFDAVMRDIAAAIRGAK